MPLTITLTLDLHVHTNYSHDGHDSIEKILKSAIAKKLDGVAICDHDTMEGFFAARKYVVDNHLDLIIIPGIEVTTSESHLIVLGLEEGLEKGLSLEETIRIARQKEKKGTVVIIAPHPYHPFRHSIGNLCTHSGIDAIEIFNSRYFFGVANKIASGKATRNNVTAVAGSDAHSAECVGLATIEVEVETEQKPEHEAILRMIKEGNVRIKSCKRTPFWVYFKQLL
ncbi:MAG: PHP domain-containing protein [Candidatus Syntrophoarchaeum sp.]|nr:PHP domain-containing protein [Methanomicrobia archaeon]MBL7118269.1 PHP domain-containing protein [Candidatus Syntrophoarchaeum sp.]